MLLRASFLCDVFDDFFLNSLLRLYFEGLAAGGCMGPVRCGLCHEDSIASTKKKRKNSAHPLFLGEQPNIKMHMRFFFGKKRDKNATWWKGAYASQAPQEASEKKKSRVFVRSFFLPWRRAYQG
nr:hypothetical protein [Pandoravirus aubagnensis]